MDAISTPKLRTIYACNAFIWGPNMLAITEIVLESRDYDFWTNHAKTNFQYFQAYLVPIERDYKHIWSVLNLRLQEYLVPLVMKIAFILDPHFDHDCKHNWSLL